MYVSHVRHIFTRPYKAARRPARRVTSTLPDVHTTIKAAPGVVKAVVQLAALLVGSVTGGAAGVVFEEEVLRKGRGGFFSGLYGLLIGAPLGAAILSVLVALYCF